MAVVTEIPNVDVTNRIKNNINLSPVFGLIISSTDDSVDNLCTVNVPVASPPSLNVTLKLCFPEAKVLVKLSFKVITVDPSVTV